VPLEQAPVALDTLVPAAARTPVGPGDKTLVIGAGPKRRATWRRVFALGAIAAAIAVIAMIPLKLQYNDANAERGAAAGSPPVVAAAPMPEPPAVDAAAPAPELRQPPRTRRRPEEGRRPAPRARRPSRPRWSSPRRRRLPSSWRPPRPPPRCPAAADRDAHAHGSPWGESTSTARRGVASPV
jgi:hypothetical protein